MSTFRRTLALSCLMSLSAAVPAHAALAPGQVLVPNGPGALDLGIDPATEYSAPAAAGGDVNGDGRDDIVIGRSNGGVVIPTVLFGKASGTLSVDPASSLQIVGPGQTLVTPKIVGDVNGDGYDDIVVDGNAGGSYLVYGRPSGGQVTVGEPRTVRIGRSALDTGHFVFAEGAGDVNGDDRADLLIYMGDEPAPYFVLFGGGLPSSVDPATAAPSRAVGVDQQPKAAGDVNGDGIDDLILLRFTGADTVAGHKIIYGSPSFGPVSGAPGSRGFVLTDTDVFVRAVGDISGDGRDDIALFPGDTQRRTPTVVLGRTGTTSVSATDPAAIRTFSSSYADLTGQVLPLGDVNGDGRDDVFLRANSLQATFGPRGLRPGPTRPAGIVAFGRTGTGNVAFDQPFPGAAAGTTVITQVRVERRWAISNGFSQLAGAGDITGDGIGDLLPRLAASETPIGVVRGAATPPADSTAPSVGVVYFSPTIIRNGNLAPYRYQLDLSEPAVVTMAWKPTLGGGTQTTRQLWPTTGGFAEFDGFGTGGGPRLSFGQWKVTITATDAAGNTSAPVTKTITVLN
ncbi:MAG: VCBS repeat-containing protein [Solirubrobacteraceae bacterium]|nr:VCBS repeat-containing protein [Solirubrobacteraceae bacterium]